MLVGTLVGLNVRTVTAQTGPDCTVSSQQAAFSQSEKQLLQLINNYRTQNGLGTLSSSGVLNQAAGWMSNDMAKNNRFSHTDSLGRDPGVRLRDCGYIWTNYGENIYPNGTDPQAAFDAWKKSPPHNANMLNANYKEAGIGQEGNYWTLDLGSSSSSGNTTPPSQTSITPTGGSSPSLTPTVTPSNSPTPTPTPSIILNPTDTKITLSVKLAGIGPGGNRSPKHLTRQVAVGIFDLENKQVLSGNGYLKYNGRDAFEGTIHLGQLANGNYYVKVASENTLVSLILPQFQNLNSDKPNALPQVTLTYGDLDQNNVIDIGDFNIALPCFQKKNCATKDAIDINDDGLANVLDYNLFLSSFKRYEGD